MPRNSSFHAALDDSSQECSSSRLNRVLLLEDDDIDYISVCRALDQSIIAFEYHRVSLLSEVSKAFNAEQYDVVLSDMNLPDSTGLETITSLLSIVGDTPIVVLSGTDDDVIALQAVKVGAQDFIPKQYMHDAGLINRTLRHAMERHQLKLKLEKTRDRERFLAHYDQCTSLPNRLLFLDRIHQVVLTAQRNQKKFALFFIDLDRFKHINDCIGHSAGDEVLRQVGSRMKKLVRESDTVARFGGDEFVIILQNNNSNEAMQGLAEAMIQSINEPIPYGHHQCCVGASIGVACFPRHGYSPEHLIKNADMAMYEAKKKGRNHVQFFTQTLFDQQKQFFSMEKALREALVDPDAHFTLHYQPRVKLSSGEIFSVEALIRWPHIKYGYISPAEFIPLAEDLGLIEKIDEWVLKRACQKAVQWRDLGANVRIAINISGTSFNRQSFVEDVVCPMLEQYDVDGNLLEMEITEGVLLADSQQVISRLKMLKELGFSLAIDDFGTGFSSLNYLNRFPIDMLKIDGSFICDSSGSEREQALLKAIIALGNALNMTVVAECVETAAQQQYLLSLNCHEGQGYYWCKPDEHWMPEPKEEFSPLHMVSDKR